MTHGTVDRGAPRFFWSSSREEQYANSEANTDFGGKVKVLPDLQFNDHIMLMKTNCNTTRMKVRTFELRSAVVYETLKPKHATYFAASTSDM